MSKTTNPVDVISSAIIEARQQIIDRLLAEIRSEYRAGVDIEHTRHRLTRLASQNASCWSGGPMSPTNIIERLTHDAALALAADSNLLQIAAHR